jgi:predicted DNA-binding protein (MmcQ/YjbR family)
MFRFKSPIQFRLELLQSRRHQSAKCAPEEFAELTERDGIIPGPYAARYHWVAVQKQGVLNQADCPTHLC